MFANPNKPIDLIFSIIPQKYFVFVALAIAHFVVPFAWVDIVSVVLVGLVLHLLRKRQILNPAVAAAERISKFGTLFSSGMLGYITAEKGAKNAKESTDHFVAFDRR